jgi:uroporphyrinogen decarboxylase
VKIPFAPSVYEHAAALIGRTPWEASRDADLMFAGHKAAYLEYGHSPIVVGIDIYNLEAEAYGVVVVEPSGNGIPAIVEPKAESIKEALKLPPYDPGRDGRIAMVIEVGRRLKREFPGADVRLPVSGPFSIAVSLRGIGGLLEDVLDDPAGVAGWLMMLAENQAAYCRAIVEAGLDVAFFESAAAPPMLSPRQFHDIELPALRRAMAVAATIAGHPVPCVIGGDTTPILKDILDTGTGYVVCPFEAPDQAAWLAIAATRPQVVVRINMDLRIVSRGPDEAIIREVGRVLALARTRERCVLGTGALPYEAPPRHVKLIKAYVGT